MISVSVDWRSSFVDLRRSNSSFVISIFFCGLFLDIVILVGVHWCVHIIDTHSSSEHEYTRGYLIMVQNNLSIRIPICKEIHKKIKERARVEGVSVSRIVRQLCQLWGEGAISIVHREVVEVQVEKDHAGDK